MSCNDAKQWCDRLLALGAQVRDRVIAARSAGEDLATAVAQEGVVFNQQQSHR